MSARRPPSLAFGSFLLVLAADALLWGHVPGWTLALLALLTAALLLLRRPALGTSPPARVCLGLVVLLCGALVLDAGLLASCVTLGLLFVLALAGRHGWERGLGEWFGLVLNLLLFLPWRFEVDALRLGALARRRRARGDRRARVAPALAAAILPVAFLILFTVANPVLRAWLLDAGRSIEPLTNPARWVSWVGLFLACWALLRARAPRLEASLPAVSQWSLAALLDRDDVLVPALAGCNAVFAVQTLLDVRYLWLGRTLPEGLTYAQYAQRGAYPLMLASLLAALFVLWAWRDGVGERSTTARLLVLPWLGQTLLLTGASAWRLGLYVQAYGLTRWRLAAALWMLLVAFGLAAITWRLWARASSHRLVQVNLAAAMGLLVACSYADLDGSIANFNVAHCRELGGPGTFIDARYLESLGEEALPALRRLEREGDTDFVRSRGRSARERLEAELERRLEDPLAWTWRRAALVESPAWSRQLGASSSPAFPPASP